MRGLDAKSGKHLDDLAHLRQSIEVILTTRLGTRVMRPEFGSRLPELIDRPLTQETLVRMYAATAEALEKHEFRVKLTRVQVNSGGDGVAVIDLDLRYLHDGQDFRLEGIQVERV